MRFIIRAYGHPLIKATHKSTFEITKEDYLTERGDCIIGIRATHSVKDLPKDLKSYLKTGKPIKIILKVGDIYDKIIAYGSKNLILSNSKSIVVRRSTYVDDRTLAIKANKAARDIDRRIIERLRKGEVLEFMIEW